MQPFIVSILFSNSQVNLLDNKIESNCPNLSREAGYPLQQAILPKSFSVFCVQVIFFLLCPKNFYGLVLNQYTHIYIYIQMIFATYFLV